MHYGIFKFVIYLFINAFKKIFVNNISCHVAQMFTNEKTKMANNRV